MPQNRAAWIKQAFGNPLEVEDAPYNIPGPSDVIIKSHAMAINPVDWKMQDHDILFVSGYPAIFGCDVSGIIEEVGGDVRGFRKGDRVIGQPPCLIKGKDYGAFQLYVRCPANVVCKIPDWMAFETACVIPLAVNTAGIGLFAKDNLNLSLASAKKSSTNSAIFIYGGSTSVGSVAIQLAKASGVFVVATAGAANIEHCKALGADEVFDYKSGGWISKAAATLKEKELVGVYDCLHTAPTVSACFSILEELKSSAPVILISPLPEGLSPPHNNPIKSVFGANVTDDNDLANAIWTDFLPEALEKKVIVPKPDPQVVGEDLESIQKAMDLQKQGVSARKLVVKIA